uniref:Uncharacterized protein n=1 Tax=Rhizophora mucronata TaxID=61149 RepID=A0A2P2JUU9_RHIMU
MIRSSFPTFGRVFGSITRLIRISSILIRLFFSFSFWFLERLLF